MIRHSGILIAETSLDDFGNFVRQVVREELTLQLNNLSVPKKKVQEELISKKAAAAFLKISLPSLSKYVQNGLVPCHRLGSNLRFRQSELDHCLSTVRNKRHNKIISNT